LNVIHTEKVGWNNLVLECDLQLVLKVFGEDQILM